MIKKSTLFNLFACIILVLDILIGCLPQYNLYLNIISVIMVMIVIFGVFVKNGLTIKFIIISLIDVLIVAVTKDVSNISLLIFISLLYLGEKNYNDLTNKSLFYTSVTTLSIILFCYFIFGFNRQYDTTIWRPLEGKSISRLSLGFTHPNQFMIRFFMTFALGLFVFKHKVTYSILFSIITFGINNLTKSRTVFYIILAITFIIFILRILKINITMTINNKFKNVLAFSFIFFLIFSIFMSLWFAETSIDTYFSGRLLINKRFIEEGITLFGNKNLALETFDNSYLHMLLSSGLIFTLVYSFIWTYYFLYIKNLKLVNFLVFIGVLVLAFMEVCMLKYSIMILIMIIIFEKSKLREDVNCLVKNQSFNLQIN